MEKYLSLLGKKVRDRVTKMEGIVSTVGFDLYGCVQAVVTPSLNADGKLGDSCWFDWKRLEILDHTPVLPAPTYRNPGEEIGAAEKPLKRG